MEEKLSATFVTSERNFRVASEIDEHKHPIVLPTLLRLDSWMLLHTELNWIYDGKVGHQYLETSRHYPGQSILLIRRGTVSIRTVAGSVQGEAGDWILPTYNDRVQKFSSDAEVLSIHLQLHWSGSDPLFNWAVAAKFRASDVPRLESQSRRLHRFVKREFPAAHIDLSWQYSSLVAYVRLQHCFSAWLCTFIDTLTALGEVSQCLDRIDSRIVHAVRLLDQTSPDARFKKSEFAKRVNLSPTHLDRLFVQQLGITPRRYWERRKLTQAIKRLRGVNAAGAIKEIAFDLGFNSLSHFSAWFCQKAGMPPRQFQMQGYGTPDDLEGKPPSRRR